MYSFAVFGSLGEVRDKLTKHSKSTDIVIQPPLDFIRTNTEGLDLLDDDMSFLSREISFVTSESLTKDEFRSFLDKSELTVAPLMKRSEIEGEDDEAEDSQEELLLANEVDSIFVQDIMKSQVLREALFNRLGAVIEAEANEGFENMIYNNPEAVGSEIEVAMDELLRPALIAARNSVLSELLKNATNFGIFTFVETEYDFEENSLECLEDADIQEMQTIRLDFEVRGNEVSGVNLNPQGDFILTTSTMTTYLIENFCPGMLILMSRNTKEDMVDVFVWQVTPDGYGGLSPVAAKQWYEETYLKIAGKNDMEVGVDLPYEDDRRFCWAQDIPVISMPLVNNVLPREQVDSIDEFIRDSIEDLYDDEDDDDEGLD